MQYKIDYLDSKGLIGSKVHHGLLSDAQAVAEKAIADKMADVVEIRDADGNLIFRRPRSIARA